MDDICIEPDPGQLARVEIEDFNDNVYAAFQKGETIFIGESKVSIVKYTRLKQLNYQSGHMAIVVVQNQT